MSRQPIVWIIKRNCSATPAQLASLFASIVALSFIFGVGFAAFGLWMVLPFVGIELLAVAAAFFVYGRHAADVERIELSDDVVRVEQVDGSAKREWRCAALGRASKLRVAPVTLIVCTRFWRRAANASRLAAICRTQGDLHWPAN